MNLTSEGDLYVSAFIETGVANTFDLRSGNILYSHSFSESAIDMDVDNETEGDTPRG